MKILLYEHLTGGGLPAEELNQPSAAGWLREGAAMFAAVAEDLLRIAGVRVLASRDARLPIPLPPGVDAVPVTSPEQARSAFAQLATAADAALIIAPECDGVLLGLCRWAEQLGVRLLSPGSPLVALSGDKQATAAALLAAGVPVPPAVPIPPGGGLPLDFCFPGVLKPRDGAGSLDTCYVADRAAALQMPACSRPMRLERFCPGLPASVAFLCGPCGSVALPAGRQHMSPDGRFRYLGGSLPLDGELCRRAQRLAGRALAALPASRGYVGVDLILGEAADGSRDVVLEVNPRLTTSYLGLRRLCRQNLGEVMLRAARGEAVELSWREGSVEFDVDSIRRS